jgi:hypothetical protein
LPVYNETRRLRRRRGGGKKTTVRVKFERDRKTRDAGGLKMKKKSRQEKKKENVSRLNVVGLPVEEK